MAFSKGWKPGRWKVVCDRCGFRFHSDALKLEWTGLRVCSGCFETRNPQDFLRVQPEKIVPEWVRPEPADTFASTCDLWSASPMADFGGADCCTVGGNTNIPLLISVFGASSVAARAITSRSIAGVFP